MKNEKTAATRPLLRYMASRARRHSPYSGQLAIYSAPMLVRRLKPQLSHPSLVGISWRIDRLGFALQDFAAPMNTKS